MEITSEEQNKVKRMTTTEDSVRDLWDNIKSTNIRIIGVPEREGKKVRVWEKFWRDYTWKFPYHGKGNIQSSPRGTKSPINPRKNTPRCILIKLTKTKHQERIWKATGGGKSNKQGKPHKLNSWSFSRNSAGQMGMAGYI